MRIVTTFLVMSAVIITQVRSPTQPSVSQDSNNPTTKPTRSYSTRDYTSKNLNNKKKPPNRANTWPRRKQDKAYSRSTGRGYKDNSQTSQETLFGNLFVNDFIQNQKQGGGAFNNLPLTHFVRDWNRRKSSFVLLKSCNNVELEECFNKVYEEYIKSREYAMSINTLAELATNTLTDNDIITAGPYRKDLLKKLKKSQLVKSASEVRKEYFKDLTELLTLLSTGDEGSVRSEFHGFFSPTPSSENNGDCPYTIDNLDKLEETSKDIKNSLTNKSIIQSLTEQSSKECQVNTFDCIKECQGLKNKNISFVCLYLYKLIAYLIFKLIVVAIKILYTNFEEISDFLKTQQNLNFSLPLCKVLVMVES